MKDEKRAVTFKKGEIAYDGIIKKTFSVDETIVKEIQKKLIRRACIMGYP